jgi:hypothetical protein
MRQWLLLAFLVTIGVDWPHLPFNARLTDLLFVLAALAVVANHLAPGSTERRGREGGRPAITPLDLAVVGYIAGSVPAVIFSPDQRASAIELVRQLYLVAVYAVIAMAVRQGLVRAIAAGLALSGAALVALGLAALAIVAVSGIGSPMLTPVMSLPYIGDTARLSPLTSTPAMLACLLAVSLPFAALHPSVSASRPRAIGAGVMFGAGALLTYSHSIAGVAVSAVAAAWQSIRAHVPLRSAAIALAVLTVVAMNFAASVSIRAIGSSALRDNTVFQYGVDGGVATVLGVNVEYQTMSYLRIKQVALDAFLKRPLVGVGLDRFHRVTEVAAAEGRLTPAYRTIDPHSTFFGRFAEAGLIGGVTLIALWITIAVTVDRLLARDRDVWIAVAVAAGLAGTLVNTMNADVMNFRFLWVALGLVRGLTAPPAQTRRFL